MFLNVDISASIVEMWNSWYKLMKIFMFTPKIEKLKWFWAKVCITGDRNKSWKWFETLGNKIQQCISYTYITTVKYSHIFN